MEIDEYDLLVTPQTVTDANDWARTTGTQLNPSQESPATDPAPEPVTRASPAFHVETRLPSGKPALLLDIGSVGNLAGDEW
eukprot:11495572-Alexandrium_andersonii.AAC.1